MKVGCRMSNLAVHNWDVNVNMMWNLKCDSALQDGDVNIYILDVNWKITTVPAPAYLADKKILPQMRRKSSQTFVTPKAHATLTSTLDEQHSYPCTRIKHAHISTYRVM